MLKHLDIRILINLEELSNTLQEDQIEIFVEKDIANLFNITPGDVLDIEAYWDERNPVVSVYCLLYTSPSPRD